MPATVELTLEQLIEAIEQLTPEEARSVLAALRRKEREIFGPLAIDRDKLEKEEALARLLSLSDAPVADWEQMEEEIIQARLEAYKQELLHRREQARREMAEGKLLSSEEAFASDV